MVGDRESALTDRGDTAEDLPVLTRQGEGADTTMGKLDGKVALVTGASRGIGRAIALAFAS